MPEPGCRPYLHAVERDVDVREPADDRTVVVDRVLATAAANFFSIAIDVPCEMSVMMATLAPADRHASACETIFCGSFNAFVIE